MLSFFSKSSQPSETREGKVVAFLNQKGGVGKTTMAFNTARALSEKGHKVLCIDMDPQANLSLLFGLSEEKFHIHHLLLNSLRELKALHTPVITSELIKKYQDSDVYLDILPSGQELSGFELSVAGINAPRQLVLKRFIEKNSLKKHYDFIVIDGPPTLGLLVVNILCAANGLLIPFQPDQFSRSGLKHFHEVLEDVSEMGITDSPKIIGYIPNLVDKRRKQVSSDFKLISQELNKGPLFQEFANKVQLVKASAKKKSVFDYKTKEYAHLQEQFLDLAQNIGEQLS